MATTTRRRATQTIRLTPIESGSTSDAKLIPKPKKTTDSKKAPKKTKKTSSISIKGAELNYDQIKEIIRLLFAQKRINAIELFREYTKADATKAIELLRKFWNEDFVKIMEQDPKMVEEFMPEKCCANCIGACGKKQTIMKRPMFIPSESAFEGHNCSRFMTEEAFLGREDRIISLNKSDVRRNLEFVLNSPITSIKYCKDRSIRRSKDREIVKFLITDKKGVLKSIIKKLFAGWSITNDAACHKSLRVFGIEPKKGETYNEYMTRAQESFRKERTEARDKIKAMPDKDIKDMLLGLLRDNGLDAILNDSYNGDIEKMLEDYYPEKSLHDVAISLTIH